MYSSKLTGEQVAADFIISFQNEAEFKVFVEVNAEGNVSANCTPSSQRIKMSLNWSIADNTVSVNLDTSPFEI